MEDNPLPVWLDLMLIPARMQTALCLDMMTAALHVSGASIEWVQGARQSRVKLSIVASNNWIKPAKSAAKLSLAKG
jgi:hypothetical protein